MIFLIYKVYVELIEIIQSALSIFSAVSFVVILFSYTIFKIRDRKRLKPYLRPDPLAGKIFIKYGESKEIENGENQTSQPEEEPEAPAFASKRFKLVNEKVSSKNERSYIKKEPVSDRFNMYYYYSDSSVRPFYKLKLPESVNNQL